ncbi:DUF6458 family protein [Herbidospora solisilvae]|uniref:DUF6458 family protein n=2 Tax=Herbidospora TaxID=28443 RepID=UPI002E28CDE7|nr:DUF6458 family protein [Herbidospora solisilvae]
MNCRVDGVFMGFGASLAFVVVGAVLAFAVKWEAPGFDLQAIGWIMMCVGVVSGVVTTLLARRRHSSDQVVEDDLVNTVDMRDETL